MSTLPTNDFDCNYIKDTVCKIDKLQKEVVSDTLGRCISCETSLFTSLNNTIPVSFYTCCGNPILGRIGPTDTITAIFRIEALRCNRFVTLRLLISDGAAEPTITATDYTLTVDLDCVSSIQCYEPITVAVCGATTE